MEDIKIERRTMKLFTKAEPRYKIKAHFFTILRERLHLSVEQFAATVGWSASYQYKLEEGRFNTISEKTVKEICVAFDRYGIRISFKD